MVRARLRLKRTGLAPRLGALPKKCHFHLYASHVWSSGQDVTHTLVRQLQRLLPGIRIWLDVDCLEDIDRLEESVEDAAVFLLVLSQGYFQSRNCLREVYAAISAGKPILTIKAAGDVTDMLAECRESSTHESVLEKYPDVGLEELMAKVFEREPMLWARIYAYQIESLKLVALRTLQHLPLYVKHPATLRGGLFVPGECGRHAFSGPFNILTSAANEGAHALAEEAKATCPCRYHVTLISSTESALEADLLTCTAPAVLLLYLNERTFGPDGAVAAMVKRAMDVGLPVVTAHKVECKFAHLLETCPQFLLKPPYQLFSSQISIPLYPSLELRRVSMMHLLRSMGARPPAALQVRIPSFMTSSSFSKLWRQYGGGALEPVLASGAVALLDAQWIVSHAEAGGVLTRRQALPKEAFLSLADLVKATGKYNFPVAALSYPWLTKDHPDPRGANLRSVAMALKALLKCYPLGQQYGIFWDFGSLHQHPDPSNGVMRTEEQNALFKQGLGYLSALYSHPHTIVLRLTSFPDGHEAEDHAEGTNVAKYFDRGWCFAETAWASLTKDSSKSLDLGRMTGEAKYRNTLVTECTQGGGRRPPLLPSRFAAALETKSFTNGKDDKPLVKRLYEAAFEEQFGKATVLRYVGLGWGDAEAAQLAEVLASGAAPRLEELYLYGNKIGDEGCKALAAALRTLRSLTKLTVDSKPHVLRDVCEERGIRLLFGGRQK